MQLNKIFEISSFRCLDVCTDVISSFEALIWDMSMTFGLGYPLVTQRYRFWQLKFPQSISLPIPGWCVRGIMVLGRKFLYR